MEVQAQSPDEPAIEPDLRAAPFHLDSAIDRIARDPEASRAESIENDGPTTMDDGQTAVVRPGDEKVREGVKVECRHDLRHVRRA